MTKAGECAVGVSTARRRLAESWGPFVPLKGIGGRKWGRTK